MKSPNPLAPTISEFIPFDRIFLTRSFADASCPRPCLQQPCKRFIEIVFYAN